MVRWMLQLDEAGLLFMRRWQGASMTRLMTAFTRAGDASTWTLLTLVLLAGGPTMARVGILMGCAAFAATLVSQALKRVCRRRRPSAAGLKGFTALIDNPDAFSFPSGHTAAAAAVAVALSGNGWLGGLHLGLAGCIGLSRIYLGAHYPLDVAAGAFLGVLAGTAVRLFL